MSSLRPPRDGYDERDSDGGTHNNGHKADAEDEAAEAAESVLLEVVTLAGVEDAVRLRGNFRKSGAVLLPSVRISTGNL